MHTVYILSILSPNFFLSKTHAVLLSQFMLLIIGSTKQSNMSCKISYPKVCFYIRNKTKDNKQLCKNLLCMSYGDGISIKMK